MLIANKIFRTRLGFLLRVFDKQSLPNEPQHDKTNKMNVRPARMQVDQRLEKSVIYYDKVKFSINTFEVFVYVFKSCNRVIS